MVDNIELAALAWQFRAREAQYDWGSTCDFALHFELMSWKPDVHGSLYSLLDIYLNVSSGVEH